MVIDKVVFHNWIGFQLGMDTDTLEIDFTKRKHRVCLVVGTNGSGKTALLEGLTLFPNIYSSVRDSNDFIVTDENDKKEGSREIYFHNGQDSYVSKCYWINNVTKCYLFRTTNGIEEDLNPNGNVTSYNEQLALRFGLTKDLDRLLFLGPGLKDIISLIPSERKSQISKFTPNIDKYLELHKQSGKYFSKLKADISVVVSELNRLGNDKNRLIQIRDANKVKYEKTLENLQFLKHVESTTTQTIDMLSINGTPVIDLYKKRVETNNQLVETLNNLNMTYHGLCQVQNISSDLDELVYQQELNKAHDEKLKLEFSVGNFNKRYSELLETKASLENALSVKIAYHEAYVAENNPERFVNEQKGLYLEKEQIVKVLTEIGKEVPELADIGSVVFTKLDSDKYLAFVDNLMSRIDVMNYTYSEHQVIENWLNDNTTSPENYVQQIQSEIAQKQAELKVEDEQSLEYETGKRIEDLLAQIPSDCNSTKCPFVKMSKGINGNPFGSNRRLELIDEIKVLEGKLKDAEETINLTVRFYKEIQLFGNWLSDNMELIAKFPDRQILSNPKTIFRNTAFLLPRARRYSEYAYAKDRYDEIVSKVAELADQIQKTASYQITVDTQIQEIKSLESSVQKTEADLQQLYNDNKAIADKDLMLSTRMKDLQTIIDCRKSLVNGLRQLGQTRKDIKKLRKHYYASMYFNDKLEELRVKIRTVSGDLNQYKIELDTSEYNLRRFDEFIVKKNALEKEYQLLDTLRKCWSPTTGVPLIFIKGFMDQLLSDANKYLAEIFTDKEFLIQGFDIDEKNFFILINRGEVGVKPKDASQCSAAERAMLCTVLSLALLKQLPHMEDTFNITKFDEIDGALDYDKRRVFIGILTDLLDEIHGEQSFFISHSDTFQNDVDVILLKGSEEYEARLLNGNYNVIYRY